MITREEYNKALDMVEAYHKQLDLQIASRIRKREDLKVGDTIVFDRVMSKYIEVGKEYKVLYVSTDFKNWRGIFEIRFEIRTENNKIKRMRIYTQGYIWHIVGFS